MSNVITIVLLLVLAALVLAGLFFLVRGIQLTVLAARKPPPTDEEKRRQAAIKRWGSQNRGGSNPGYDTNLYDP